MQLCIQPSFGFHRGAASIHLNQKVHRQNERRFKNSSCNRHRCWEFIRVFFCPDETGQRIYNPLMEPDRWHVKSLPLRRYIVDAFIVTRFTVIAILIVIGNAWWKSHAYLPSAWILLRCFKINCIEIYWIIYQPFRNAFIDSNLGWAFYPASLIG